MPSTPTRRTTWHSLTTAQKHERLQALRRRQHRQIEVEIKRLRSTA